MSPPITGRVRRSVLPLVAVGVAFGLAQVGFVPPGMDLGWDEAVYVSQVAPAVPDADFSAPRARGITWLAAPVASFTAEPVAIRLWMALLSSVGLVLAFLPWLRLVRRGVVALAALLLAGLWVVQFYGPAVYPNIAVAFGAVGAAGFFLLTARGPAAPDRSWHARLGLAGCAAVVVLVRPMEAVTLGGALLAAVAVVPGWRRLGLVWPLAAGLAAGVAPWVAESYLRYGGLPARIRESSEVQGGMRPTIGFWYELKAANGPSLCRPCDIPFDLPYLAMWLPAIPLAVAGGLVVAWRAGRLAPYGLAAWCGFGLAAPYLFLVDYAAPRFLIPAYALLALPVAGLLVWLAGRRPRRVFGTLAALVVAGHLGLQHAVLQDRVAAVAGDRAGLAAVVAALRAAGVGPPCVLAGDAARVPLAYKARCATGEAADAYVTTTERPPQAGWLRVPGRGLRVHGSRVTIWVPPGR